MRRLLVLVALLAPATAAAAPREVNVRDDYFSTPTLTVRKGSVVKWVWRGEAPHNVVVQSGPVKFRSPLKVTGTYRRKLRKAGTYRLLCTVHQPDMAMTLKVRR